MHRIQRLLPLLQRTLHCPCLVPRLFDTQLYQQLFPANAVVKLLEAILSSEGLTVVIEETILFFFCLPKAT